MPWTQPKTFKMSYSSTAAKYMTHFQDQIHVLRMTAAYKDTKTTSVYIGHFLQCILETVYFIHSMT